MKKGKLVIGILLGLITIGLVSAVLVSYLSNTATVDIEVKSPMSIAFAEVDHGADVTTAISNVGALTGDDWSDDLTTSSITGLSTLELGVRLVNNADVNIEDKTLAITLSNGAYNVDCNDVTSLTFIDVGASVGTTYYQVIQELVGLGLCTDNGYDVTYSIPINSLGSGQTFKYPVTITFGIVEPTTYTASGKVIN